MPKAVYCMRLLCCTYALNNERIDCRFSRKSLLYSQSRILSHSPCIWAQWERVMQHKLQSDKMKDTYCHKYQWLGSMHDRSTLPPLAWDSTNHMRVLFTRVLEISYKAAGSICINALIIFKYTATCIPKWFLWWIVSTVTYVISCTYHFLYHCFINIVWCVHSVSCCGMITCCWLFFTNYKRATSHWRRG